MRTESVIQVQAPASEVYTLAERIQDWPNILPHYRWVRVLRQDEHRRLAAMSAWRDWIPVRWVGLQERDPDRLTIRYRHVAGVTRGMQVLWEITPADGGTRVRLSHVFRPHWPLVPDWLVQRIIGEQFVEVIAAKTLQRVKAIAESRAVPEVIA